MTLIYEPPHPVEDGPGMSHYVGQPVEVLGEVRAQYCLWQITHVSVRFPNGLERTIPVAHLRDGVPATPDAIPDGIWTDAPKVKINITVTAEASETITLDEVLQDYAEEWRQELERADGDAVAAIWSFARAYAEGMDPSDVIDTDVHIGQDARDLLACYQQLLPVGDLADPYFRGGP